MGTLCPILDEVWAGRLLRVSSAFRTATDEEKYSDENKESEWDDNSKKNLHCGGESGGAFSRAITKMSEIVERFSGTYSAALDEEGPDEDAVGNELNEDIGGNLQTFRQSSVTSVLAYAEDDDDGVAGLIKKSCVAFSREDGGLKTGQTA